MSSPYITLGNRPLEQWKVTELKEELKKRKLTTKGLKEDLLKRLDEAVRIERANAAAIAQDDEPELPSDQANTEPVASGKDKAPIDINAGVGEKRNAKSEREIDDRRSTLSDIILETDLVKGAKASGTEGQPVETTVVIGETALSGSFLHIDGKRKGDDSSAVVSNDGLLSLQENAKLELSDLNNQLPENNESLDKAPPSESGVQDSETWHESKHSTVQIESDDSKCLQPDSSAQPLKYQVSEVNPDLGSQVTSDSVSTESVPIIEKNELKVDVITDNVKLELDVKPEMGQTSASTADPDGGKLDPAGDEAPLDNNDVHVPLDKKDIEEPIDNQNVEQPSDKVLSTENVDNLQNIDTVDLGGPEKLSLDRSSGDDSMEEDVLDSKQTEYKSDSNKTNDMMEESGKPITNEDDHVDVVGHDKPIETKAADTENETVLAKRKFHDKEPAEHNDTAKKARRWNTEGPKGSEQQSGNAAISVTPRGITEPTFKRTGSDLGVNEESPKERIVPPSSKSPTNSLRIDRFLRPFTLKAVQELLGKTGTVSSFWMDHIKTHCYVSYSSVEEAVETRNAVYNLQWPPNGGRTLVAEFVDPQEVKARLEAPPVTPTTPSSSAAANFSASKTQPIVPPQPSPRQQVLRQQLPPPPLPLPQLSNPPFTKEQRLHPPREPLPREQPLPARDRLNLPLPPPPLPEKVDPPIVTLDDLFRKTKATPRIYYLPLSDEQVAVRVKSQGKNVNQ